MVLTVANFGTHDEDEEKHVRTLLTSEGLDGMKSTTHQASSGSLRLSRWLRSDHVVFKLSSKFRLRHWPSVRDTMFLHVERRV